MFLTSFPAGPLQANCYVFSGDDTHAVVVDPGVNALVARPNMVSLSQAIMAALKTRPRKGDATSTSGSTAAPREAAMNRLG